DNTRELLLKIGVFDVSIPYEKSNPLAISAMKAGSSVWRRQTGVGVTSKSTQSASLISSDSDLLRRTRANFAPLQPPCGQCQNRPFCWLGNADPVHLRKGETPSRAESCGHLRCSRTKSTRVNERCRK